MALHSVRKCFATRINIKHYSRYRPGQIKPIQEQHKNFSTSNISNGKTNKPIEYSATKASKMRTDDTLYIKPHPAVLPIERFVVAGCIVVILIYAYFRKENKIDRIISGDFNYEGDDEIKISNALLRAKLKGLNTEDLERKLKEIRAQK